MERQKLVADIRRKDINLPESFEEEKRPKQVWMEEARAGGREWSGVGRQEEGKVEQERACVISAFPSPFQAKMVRWLLNHTPHERPTATDLLQCPLLPPKMEDEELQEVMEQNTAILTT